MDTFYGQFLWILLWKLLWKYFWGFFGDTFFKTYTFCGHFKNTLGVLLGTICIGQETQCLPYVNFLGGKIGMFFFKGGIYASQPTVHSRGGSVAVALGVGDM